MLSVVVVALVHKVLLEVVSLLVVVYVVAQVLVSYRIPVVQKDSSSALGMGHNRPEADLEGSTRALFGRLSAEVVSHVRCPDYPQ